MCPRHDEVTRSHWHVGVGDLIRVRIIVDYGKEINVQFHYNAITEIFYNLNKNYKSNCYGYKTTITVTKNYDYCII